MARRSSLWTELRREREQRQREARQAQRVHEQLIRQAAKEYDQAVRRGAREEAAERKRQEQLAHEARSAEATARTAEVEARADELRELLRSSLDAQTYIPFDALKRGDEAMGFDPGVLGQNVFLPMWEDFEPRRPGKLSGLVGEEEVRARARHCVAAIPAGAGQSRACRGSSARRAGQGGTTTCAAGGEPCPATLRGDGHDGEHHPVVSGRRHRRGRL